jgi:hypothetical protein
MTEQAHDEISHDIRRLVAVSKLPAPPTDYIAKETARIEALRPDIAPFGDQVHGLLNDSIEKITQGWVDQLKAVKDNCDALERQVMTAMAQTKDSIAKLHELGNKVADEAKRGRELCEKLSAGVAEITNEEQQ